MKKFNSCIEDIVILEPEVFHDERGWFTETYHKRKFEEYGIKSNFVQDNHSSSKRGVIRGMHFQLHHPQAKLCRVVKGQVLDFAVDVRIGSPTFGKWISALLSEENKRMIYLPEGIAHGFLTLSDEAEFIYKCSDFYFSDDQHGIAWDDPDVDICWNLLEFIEPKIVSAKDSDLPDLKDLTDDQLPKYPLR